MNHEILTQLRDQLAAAAATLKECQDAYRGFKAFKNSTQGLAFCAAQLHESATALREYVEQLASIAESMHNTYSGLPAQLELDDIAIDSRV
jgi:hypothetical protein